MPFHLQPVLKCSLASVQNSQNTTALPPKGEMLMTLESDWNVYRTRFVVRARQLTDSLIFTDALGREQSGQPGDYLVEIFDGLLSITPRKFFEAIYVPLEHLADSGTDKPASQPRDVSRDRQPAPRPSLRQAEHPSPQLVKDRGSPFNRAANMIVPAQRHATTSLIA